MDLSFYYEDEELTIEKVRPNDYRIGDAILDVASEVYTLTEAANLMYTTRMWQWFDIYKQWEKGDKVTPIFGQPELPKSESELLKHFRNVFKSAREDTISKATVIVGGLEFDADEKSQWRMLSAMEAALDDTEQATWVLADNTTTQVTRPILKEVHRASVLKMSSVWIPE